MNEKPLLQKQDRLEGRPAGRPEWWHQCVSAFTDLSYVRSGFLDCSAKCLWIAHELHAKPWQTRVVSRVVVLARRLAKPTSQPGEEPLRQRRCTWRRVAHHRLNLPGGEQRENPAGLVAEFSSVAEDLTAKSICASNALLHTELTPLMDEAQPGIGRREWIGRAHSSSPSGHAACRNRGMKKNAALSRCDSYQPSIQGVWCDSSREAARRNSCACSRQPSIS